MIFHPLPSPYTHLPEYPEGRQYILVSLFTAHDFLMSYGTSSQPDPEPTLDFSVFCAIQLYRSELECSISSLEWMCTFALIWSETPRGQDSGNTGASLYRPLQTKRELVGVCLKPYTFNLKVSKPIVFLVKSSLFWPTFFKRSLPSYEQCFIKT